MIDSLRMPPRGGKTQESFKSLGASQLYCPKCSRAMPVRERLLLVLPSGNIYDYVCTACGTLVGKKTES